MVDFGWIANNLGYESLIHTITRVWVELAPTQYQRLRMKSIASEGESGPNLC